jgi:hypothetical protein
MAKIQLFACEAGAIKSASYHCVRKFIFSTFHSYWVALLWLLTLDSFAGQMCIRFVVVDS